MARYEFVEGRSSKFWEISLDGNSLVVSYGRIGTTGQSQTKTFATPELAQKEHDKLVAEKTRKGCTLSAGQNNADASPPLPPRATKNAPAAAILRKDLYVYNEATGFAITSKRLGGKGIDGGSEPWHRAVRNGDLLPIELTQDDPFFIRVVVGGELEPQEAEEWVGRLDWKLRVPDGHLVVCGGSEYVMEAFESEEDDYMSGYVRHVEIPRGEYRATIYMYFGGVNGRPCIRVASGGDEPDPLGEWFRRTRPNEDFPAWLHNDCVHDPAEDPGHEKEWKKKKEVDDPNENYVDFLRKARRRKRSRFSFTNIRRDSTSSRSTGPSKSRSPSWSASTGWRGSARAGPSPRSASTRPPAATSSLPLLRATLKAFGSAATATPSTSVSFPPDGRAAPCAASCRGTTRA